MEPNAAGGRSSLLEFLKHNRTRLLSEWEDAVNAIPAARKLDRDAMRNHVPELLDRIIESVQQGEPSVVGELPAEHAVVRIRQGFGLEQVAQEYQLLRAVLLRMFRSDPALLDPEGVLLLNESVDHAVGRALARYHRARSRTLDMLERISQEAFASHEAGLGDFLRRFLVVILETTTPADAALIYLREWDQLVIRAAAGFETPLEGRYSVRVGEGIAGMVAARRQAYFTGPSDPLLKNAELARTGLKALYAVPLLYGDDLIGVAKVCSRSVTDFCEDDRALFDDMAQRAAVLIAHRRLAEERDVFLGVLSHDLRSPLSTLAVGTSFLRRREQLSEPGLRTVKRMASAVQRMERMIGDLTDYTRVRFGGGIRVDPQTIELAETLDQLMNELRAQYADRALELRLAGDLVGEWDRVRIGQMVSNLVSNAVAYGDPQAPIVVSADGTSAEDVVLGVHNEGPPIPPMLRSQIFRPFKRGNARSEGLGLGLYVVQHVARAHGGAAEVESAPDTGTTFRVRLRRWGAAGAS